MMPSDTSGLYLDELLSEMNLLSENPNDFKNTRILLSREISKVFENMSRKESRRNDHPVNDNQNYGFYSPQVIRPSSHVQPSHYSSFSPMNSQFPSTPQFFNSVNSFVTPIKNGNRRLPEQDLGDWSRENKSTEPYVLQTKIYIPEAPINDHCGQKTKYNYIGRILGPSGTSARMIENEYDVTLLIRGSGSMRNAETEEKFRGKKRYEHLDEPLHVLLIAKHENRQKCEEILDRAAEKIESLLIPVHDDYKKDQLVRYAILNGTYEDRAEKQTQSTGKKRRSNRINWTPK
uniref:KH domain-containing protein n=1 Tax=Caenorhabditis tropicalis TaxID=1561998 RepID=A0A1I7UCV8_9PELO